MRRWAVWDGIFLALALTACKGQALLCWGAEQGLSYLVGTRVKVGRVEALSWKGQTWQVQLRQVELGSTLPGDSLVAATLSQVTLRGHGAYIDTVRLRGVALRFVRLGKAQKNFRFFPRRADRPRTQRFWVEADSLSLWLDNLGAQLALSLTAEGAAAWVEVDSLSVSLRGLQARLDLQEVCFRGKRLPLPVRLKLALKGRYEKATDNWRETSLCVQSSSARLHFWGDILAWEQPKGWLHAEGDSSVVSSIVGSESLAAAEVKKVWLSAWIDLPGYAAFVWGRWREGEYALCAEGRQLRPSYIEGAIRWANQVDLRFRGHPDWLYIGGTWRFRGLRGKGQGILHLSDQQGRLLLTTEAQDSLWIKGNLEAISGQAKVGSLCPRITWSRATGLQIALDSTSRSEVWAAIAPYSSFLGKGGRLGWPVSVRCSYLGWDSSWGLRNLHLRVGQQLLGTAYVKLPALQETLSVEFAAGPTLQRGWASLLGRSGWASLRWVEDSLSVSAWGHWQDIVAWGSGEGSLSTRALWLRCFSAEIPGQGQAQVQGRVTLDGADVEVSAQLSLPRLWQQFPIEGVEVYQGVLAVDLCAQGTWDTLLRWDNPTQGRVSLTDVSGEFINLGLELHDLSARLHYDAENTWLDTLAVYLGEARLGAKGKLRGTLGYLYTDWRQLRGALWVEGERIALDPLWRQIKPKEKKETQRRVRLPEKIEATFGMHLRDVDVYGLYLPEVYGEAHLQGGGIWADTVAVRYAGGLLAGKGFLDGLDTSCYMLASRVSVGGVSLAQVSSDFAGYIPSSLQRAGIRGTLLGEAQFVLRFSKDAQWQEQSTIWAKGYISKGIMHTPRFLRWLRPYYLAAYRDSMDFLADVSELSISEGKLLVEDALLLTRVAAFRVHGFHDLDGDRFLYRFQGTRLYRRAQRYSDLERLPLYVQDLLDRSVLLIYLERHEGRTRWRYPWRYLLRRLLTSRIVEPALKAEPSSIPLPN